jgi:hypothetical protein
MRERFRTSCLGSGAMSADSTTRSQTISIGFLLLNRRSATLQNWHLRYT